MKNFEHIGKRGVVRMCRCLLIYDCQRTCIECIYGTGQSAYDINSGAIFLQYRHRHGGTRQCTIYQ